MKLPLLRIAVSCLRTAILPLAVSGAHIVAGEPSTIMRPAKNPTPPIRAAQKWNPFWSLGNADDPAPPAWFRPGAACRRVSWWMRNPLHNFTHYVIGVTDKNVTRTGKFPAHVFAPGGGWNWAFTRSRCLPLPFVSFDGKFCRSYLGWRESGNFGAKFNFKRRAENPPAAPAVR